VPTVELFITQFNVPEEVAAVTLVAFGSAAPELMLNTMGAAEHDSSLSLPSVPALWIFLKNRVLPVDFTFFVGSRLSYDRLRSYPCHSTTLLSA
jgi:hypothetical protein